LSSSATRAAAAQPQALLREGPLTGPYNRKEIDDRLGEGALVGKSAGWVPRRCLRAGSIRGGWSERRSRRKRDWTGVVRMQPTSTQFLGEVWVNERG